MFLVKILKIVSFALQKKFFYFLFLYVTFRLVWFPFVSNKCFRLLVSTAKNVLLQQFLLIFFSLSVFFSFVSLFFYFFNNVSYCCWYSYCNRVLFLGRLTDRHMCDDTSICLLLLCNIYCISYRFSFHGLFFFFFFFYFFNIYIGNFFSFISSLWYRITKAQTLNCNQK